MSVLLEHGVLGICKPPFSLGLSLDSGQAFTWTESNGRWSGTIQKTGFVLWEEDGEIRFASSDESSSSTELLENYLGLEDDPQVMIQSFPDDPFLRESIQFCKGLRILRQDPWECLAGFILSSTKKITHIRQIWQKLCIRWGEPLSMPSDFPMLHSFPEPARIAVQSEADLRSCGMGFRAPYLLAAAREIHEGNLNLEALRWMPTAEARERLVQLKGVGRKIADCVLLFSLGKTEAFPVDVWIAKVLHKAYLKKKRKVNMKMCHDFVENYFGEYGGYAQQYFFHFARMNPKIFK